MTGYSINQDSPGCGRDKDGVISLSYAETRIVLDIVKGIIDKAMSTEGGGNHG